MGDWKIGVSLQTGDWKIKVISRLGTGKGFDAQNQDRKRTTYLKIMTGNIFLD
jgi:hypothetical protein